MTQQETQTLAELSQTVKAMAEQLHQNTTDTAEIKLTLASWTGGRKTLVWVVSALLSFGIIISSIYAAITAGGHK